MCILHTFVLGDEEHNFPLEKKAAPFAVGQCTNVFVTAETYSIRCGAIQKTLRGTHGHFCVITASSSSMPPSAAPRYPPWQFCIFLIKGIDRTCHHLVSGDKIKIADFEAKVWHGSLHLRPEDSVVSSGVGSVAAVAITAVLPR